MDDRTRGLLAREVLTELVANADEADNSALAMLSLRLGPDGVKQWLMACAKARELWEGRNGWRSPMRAQVLQLLVDLQAEHGLTYLFISHDLAVVRRVAHRTGVMRDGRLRELRPTAELFDDPRDEYTRELLAAIAGRKAGVS